MLQRLRQWLQRQLKTDTEQENFLRLLQVITADSHLRQAILQVIAQAQPQRSQSITYLLQSMKQQQAPAEHLRLVAYLYRDELCQAIAQHLQSPPAGASASALQ